MTHGDVSIPNATLCSQVSWLSGEMVPACLRVSALDCASGVNERDITLSTIAEQTKIKLSLLEALERDDVSHWPLGDLSGVPSFAPTPTPSASTPTSSFASSWEVYPDPVEVVAPDAAAAPGADGARSSAGPPTRLRYLVGSAIESLPGGSAESCGRGAAGGGPGSGQRAGATAPEPEFPAVAHPASEPSQVDQSSEVAADGIPVTEPSAPAPDLLAAALVNEPASPEPDLLAAAQLCTNLGRVEERR